MPSMKCEYCEEQSAGSITVNEVNYWYCSNEDHRERALRDAQRRLERDDKQRDIKQISDDEAKRWANRLLDFLEPHIKDMIRNQLAIASTVNEVTEDSKPCWFDQQTVDVRRTVADLLALNGFKEFVFENVRGIYSPQSDGEIRLVGISYRLNDRTITCLNFDDLSPKEETLVDTMDRYGLWSDNEFNAHLAKNAGFQSKDRQVANHQLKLSRQVIRQLEGELNGIRARKESEDMP